MTESPQGNQSVLDARNAVIALITGASSMKGREYIWSALDRYELAILASDPRVEALVKAARPVQEAWDSMSLAGEAEVDPDLRHSILAFIEALRAFDQPSGNSAICSACQEPEEWTGHTNLMLRDMVKGIVSEGWHSRHLFRPSGNKPDEEVG